MFWGLRTVSIPSILGVVPVAIIAWRPEIAPQAITIKINSNTGPPITGPATGIKIVYILITIPLSTGV